MPLSVSCQSNPHVEKMALRRQSSSAPSSPYATWMLPENSLFFLNTRREVWVFWMSCSLHTEKGIVLVHLMCVRLRVCVCLRAKSVCLYVKGGVWIPDLSCWIHLIIFSHNSLVCECVSFTISRIELFFVFVNQMDFIIDWKDKLEKIIHYNLYGGDSSFCYFVTVGLTPLPHSHHPDAFCNCAPVDSIPSCFAFHSLLCPAGFEGQQGESIPRMRTLYGHCFICANQKHVHAEEESFRVFIWLAQCEHEWTWLCSVNCSLPDRTCWLGRTMAK